MTAAEFPGAGALARVVTEHGGADRAQWLAEAVAGLGTPPAAMKTRIALARCARKVGRDPVVLSAQGRERLPPGPCYEHWVLWDFGRASLVLSALGRLPAEQQVRWMEPLIRRGEHGEQVSLLRMAPLLPGPQRFVPVLVDACRTNSADVFEAIACDNPYARDFFPEPAFNQLVVKAIFIDVGVDRIDGLAERVNERLVHMVQDYRDERAAAGRSIPAGVAQIQSLARAQLSAKAEQS